MRRVAKGFVAAGLPVGWHDPFMNATYDRDGRGVGIGDLFTLLIIAP